MSGRRPRIDRLHWDNWNREHIAKHNVTLPEVDQVIAGDPIFGDSYKNRFVVTGPTIAGRMLTVIIGEDPSVGGSFYVFSARPASRQERRNYKEAKGDDLQ